MRAIISASVLSSDTHTMDLREVITSSAVMPSSLKTFFMYSMSCSSSVPSSAPASSISTMSSSDTGSSFSRGSMPIRRSTALVDTVRNHIMGRSTAAKNDITPQTAFASFSLCFMAMRFGTSSPRTRVKYESIMVMTITATVFTVP